MRTLALLSLLALAGCSSSFVDDPTTDAGTAPADAGAVCEFDVPEGSGADWNAAEPEAFEEAILAALESCEAAGRDSFGQAIQSYAAREANSWQRTQTPDGGLLADCVSACELATCFSRWYGPGEELCMMDEGVDALWGPGEVCGTVARCMGW